MQTPENFTNLTIEAVSGNSFAGFQMVFSFNCILFLKLRQSYKSLNNRIQITRITNVIHSSVPRPIHKFASIGATLNESTEGEVEIEIDVEFCDSFLCFFLCCNFNA